MESTPIYGWFIMENTIKWMITGATPIETTTTGRSSMLSHQDVHGRAWEPEFSGRDSRVQIGSWDGILPLYPHDNFIDFIVMIFILYPHIKPC